MVKDESLPHKMIRDIGTLTNTSFFNVANTSKQLTQSCSSFFHDNTVNQRIKRL